MSKGKEIGGREINDRRKGIIKETRQMGRRKGEEEGGGEERGEERERERGGRDREGHFILVRLR